MKFQPVPMLILAGAVLAGYMVWKRQKVANTTTNSDTPTNAQSWVQTFADLFGDPGAAKAASSSATPETAQAADNGT